MSPHLYYAVFPAIILLPTGHIPQADSLNHWKRPSRKSGTTDTDNNFQQLLIMCKDIVNFVHYEISFEITIQAVGGSAGGD